MALWNILQEVEIQQTRADARSAEELHFNRNEITQGRLDGQDDRLERLLIVNEAIWELVAERLGLTDDDLIAKIREVDQRDGAIDGLRAKHVRRCSSCGAAIQQGRATCAFCGHEEPGLDAFDAV